MDVVIKKNLPDDSIATSLGPYGFVPSSEACEKIRTYIALLLRWNERISLTSLTNIPEILHIHFGESIFAASAVPIQRGRLADVGTGAGFPGIPIKIASPELDLFLVEPNIKKCAFLSEVLRALQIDARVIRSRMDAAFTSNQQLDCITSRAVGQWDEILKMGTYSATAGKLVLWVGERTISELASLSHTGWTWQEPIKIPETTKRFVLVGRKP
jgi:16S rRNA (guanine(527)-N(7))-methyltransferase RsmG